MSLSFADVFRQHYLNMYNKQKALVESDKIRAAARKTSDLDDHYLVFSKDNLIQQLKPYLHSQAESRADQIADDLYNLIVKQFPEARSEAAKIKQKGAVFKWLFATSEADKKDGKTQSNYGRIGKIQTALKVSATAYKQDLITDWIKQNGGDLDAALFNNGGVLAKFAPGGKLSKYDPKELGKELANDLRGSLEERFGNLEDPEAQEVLADNAFSSGDLLKNMKKLAEKLVGTLKDGRVSFNEIQNMPGQTFQNLIPHLLKIIFILSKDTNATRLLQLKGGLDLGHVVSVEVEVLRDSILAGLGAQLTGVAKEQLQAAQESLLDAVVDVFDKPSYSLQESRINGRYVKTVILENSSDNKKKGTAVKKVITDLSRGKAAAVENKKLLEATLFKFLKNIEDQGFKDLERELSRIDFSELTDSPSYMKTLDSIVESAWLGRNIGNNAKIKKKQLKLSLQKPKAPKVTKTKKKVVKAPNRLKSKPKIKLSPIAASLNISQSTRQSFLNLTKIKLYVNSHMHDRMQEKMKGQRLNYRSGRLARSAQVVNIQQTRKDTIALYYTYMKNPYATFAKGGKQHTPRRDVDNLIMASARSLAREVVANKFKLSIRGT
jgi:hypothetical protein